MIKLFRLRDCSPCAEIETTLKELVVAHEVITLETDEAHAALGPEVALPAIKENGRTISGPAVISAYLKELEQFVSEWRRFQSDSCYINDNGETC
jgi:glutaredoxin